MSLSAKVWAALNAQFKQPWYRPWQRGYTKACQDILLLLQEDCPVEVIPIEEYRAIEGFIEGLKNDYWRDEN